MPMIGNLVLKVAIVCTSFEIRSSVQRELLRFAAVGLLFVDRWRPPYAIVWGSVYPACFGEARRSEHVKSLNVAP